MESSGGVATTPLLVKKYIYVKNNLGVLASIQPGVKLIVTYHQLFNDTTPIHRPVGTTHPPTAAPADASAESAAVTETSSASAASDGAPHPTVAVAAATPAEDATVTSANESDADAAEKYPYFELDYRYFASIRRAWCGDRRDVTLVALQRFINIMNELITELTPVQVGMLKGIPSMSGNPWYSLSTTSTEVMCGLSHLSMTYAEDARCKAELATIIEQFRAIGNIVTANLAQPTSAPTPVVAPAPTPVASSSSSSSSSSTLGHATKAAVSTTKASMVPLPGLKNATPIILDASSAASLETMIRQVKTAQVSDHQRLLKLINLLQVSQRTCFLEIADRMNAHSTSFLGYNVSVSAATWCTMEALGAAFVFSSNSSGGHGTTLPSTF